MKTQLSLFEEFMLRFTTLKDVAKGCAELISRSAMSAFAVAIGGKADLAPLLGHKRTLPLGWADHQKPRHHGQFPFLISPRHRVNLF